MAALYDTIGLNYADLRQPDPSIERAIQSALGDAAIIVNVGAGCGSYEPSDRSVVAVELRARADGLIATFEHVRKTVVPIAMARLVVSHHQNDITQSCIPR